MTSYNNPENSSACIKMLVYPGAGYRNRFAAGKPASYLRAEGDRILTETDGLSAIRWVYEEASLPEPEYESEYDLIPAVLHASLDAYARYHDLTREEAILRIYQNFQAFDL